MRFRLRTLLIVLIPATIAFLYVGVGRMVFGHIAIGGGTVQDDVVAGIIAALAAGFLGALLAFVTGPSKGK